MSVIKTWKITYAPANEPNSGEVRTFTGTREEMDAWFRDSVICGACRSDMENGTAYLDGSGKEIERGEPYYNPWHSGCGFEWDLEEVA